MWRDWNSRKNFNGSERFQGGIDDVLDATFKSGPALPGAVPFSRLEHIEVPGYHLEARGSYEGFNLLALFSRVPSIRKISGGGLVGNLNQPRESLGLLLSHRHYASVLPDMRR